MAKIIDLHGTPPAPIGEAQLGPKVLERVRWCRRIDARIRAGERLTAAIRAVRNEAADAPPSVNTLRRWFGAWRNGGAEALADGRRGRERKVYGWAAKAIDYWNDPTRPTRATVAYWLREDGWRSATAARVRRYLQSLPASVGGEHTKRRAGAHYHRQNVAPYVLRDETVLDVGLIYQGDGHRCDVYVQHPRSGAHYRPELTVWLDVRTHCCAGWWLSEDESAISTLHGLSKTLTKHDHVPAALHVDPGSGFENRMLQDEITGWLNRLGIDVITALPGNAKGKGLVEGWFRWFEERCGKRFESYMQGRTDRALSRLEANVRAGKVRIPTLPEYAAAVEAYCRSYNATPQKRLGAAPSQLWAALDRSAVEVPEAVLLRPTETRIVQRSGLSLWGRLYRAPQLAMVEGFKVEVEYDLADGERVWVNYRGKRVCEAHLVKRVPWAHPSRIEDLRAKREAGQKKRLERKLLEVEARSRAVVDSDALAEDAAALAPPEKIEPDFNPYDVLPEA